MGIAEPMVTIPLSEYERRVFETIQLHSSYWVTFEGICAETLLSPNLVMRMLLMLTEKELIRTNGDAPPSEIQVRASTASDLVDDSGSPDPVQEAIYRQLRLLTIHATTMEARLIPELLAGLETLHRLFGGAENKPWLTDVVAGDGIKLSTYYYTNATGEVVVPKEATTVKADASNLGTRSDGAPHCSCARDAESLTASIEVLKRVFAVDNALNPRDVRLHVAK